MLLCAFALCVRDATGCAPSRNVVEPAANAYILRRVPGACALKLLAGARAPDERSDEFLSPETRKRYGCGARRAAVKVL